MKWVRGRFGNGILFRYELVVVVFICGIDDDSQICSYSNSNLIFN